MVKSLLGIARQWSRGRFAVLTLKPRSHVRILIYRTWGFQNRPAAVRESFRRWVTLSQYSFCLACLFGLKSVTQWTVLKVTVTWFISSKQDQDRQKQLAQQRLVTWQQKDQSELSKVKERLNTLETKANPPPVSSASIGALQVRMKVTVNAVMLFDYDPCTNPFRFLNLQTSIRTPAV